MSNDVSEIAFHLQQLCEGNADTAFHGLLELPDGACPELVNAFTESTDLSTRTLLLKVMWQRRQPEAIPLLAEALFDVEQEIWQEALDGLVALACPESLQALQRAKARPLTTERERQSFRKWLEEAIGQVESVASPSSPE